MKCQCGCGKDTPLATQTDRRRGHIKGKPLPFCPSHHVKADGKKKKTSKQPARVKPVNLSLPGIPGPTDPLDEHQIQMLRSLDDDDAFVVFDGRLRQLEKQYRATFVERGFILIEVSERRLWEGRKDPETGDEYTSFENWVVKAATHSRSDCFAAMKAVRELRDVPADDLLEIPRCNVETLRELSPKVRAMPTVIAAAKSKTEKRFKEMLAEKHPDQHIERPKKSVFNTTESQRDLQDRAIDVARWVYDVHTREDALQFIYKYFLDGACEKEGFDQLANRLAYEAARAKGAA